MGYGDSPRKTHDMGWQSSSQLPFLIMNTNQQNEPNTALLNKKKPQIVIQKTNHSSTSSNRTNLASNISKKWLSLLILFLILFIFPICTILLIFLSADSFIFCLLILLFSYLHILLLSCLHVLLFSYLRILLFI